MKNGANGPANRGLQIEQRKCVAISVRGGGVERGIHGATAGIGSAAADPRAMQNVCAYGHKGEYIDRHDAKAVVPGLGLYGENQHDMEGAHNETPLKLEKKAKII